MKTKKAKPNVPAPRVALDVPGLVVTILVMIFAAALVWPQLGEPQDPNNQMMLANLNDRVALLESATNWVQRDEMCVPLSAYARELDQSLKPGARVFLTGMLGETNAPALGYYFFLRNYLFPRYVGISLDGKAVFTENSGFYGVPCDSPAVLKTNGFDLMIQYANNQMQLVPLTTNGLPTHQ